MNGYLPVLDPQTVWLAGAGVLGAGLHAAVTLTRETLSRSAVVQAVLGGLGAVLLPYVWGFSDLKPWGQIVVALILTYAVPDFTIETARQIGQRLPAMLGGRFSKGDK